MLLMDEPELYARKALRSSPGQLSMFTGLEHTGTAADFREDLHPRDDDGKFRPKGVAKAGQGPTVEESPTGQRKRTMKSSAGQMPLPLGDEDVAEAKRLIQQMRGEAGPRAPLAEGEKPFSLKSGKPEPVKPTGNSVQKPLFGEDKPKLPAAEPPRSVAKPVQKPLFGEGAEKPKQADSKEPEQQPAKTTAPEPDFSLSAKPKHTPGKIEGMGKAKQVDLFAGRGDSPGQTSFFDDIDPAAKNVGAMEKKSPEQAAEAVKAGQPTNESKRHAWSTEHTDRASDILAGMETNQARMREDKKVREGERLARWVKAFEGSPREVTAAKDLFRRDFEKSRQNGVSDDRLFEIIEHGQANGMFSQQEASDLKKRIKPSVAAEGQTDQPKAKEPWSGAVMEDLVHNWDSPGIQKEWKDKFTDEQRDDIKKAFRDHHQKGKDAKQLGADLVSKWGGATSDQSTEQPNAADPLTPTERSALPETLKDVNPAFPSEVERLKGIAAGGDFQIAGMSLEKAAKLAAENGHPEAMEKIRSRPSAWKDVLEQWRDAKKSSAAQKSRDTRAANWKPSETQQGVLDKVGGGRNFPRSQDMLMWGQNKAATQQLIDRGLLERTDNGREVSYRLLQPATNSVATPQTEWNSGDLSKPADPHAELIEQASKFAQYGENYNRNIAAPLNRLLDAKAKGHSQRMLDGMAEELRMRLDAHGGKASNPADPDIDALAKSAVEANENVWTHARSAGHNPIKDWTPEQRQAFAEAVAKHREAAQPAKPEPSEGRAKAMAAQKQRDEAGTNVKHSPAMQEAIKQVSEKLGIAPAPAADTQPKPETPAPRPLDDKIASSGGLIAKIGKQMGVKPQDMEDFISDVQLKAIQGQGGYDASKGEFSTWLGTIARNHKMTQQTRANAAKRAGVTQSLATPNESGKGSLADTVAAKETARESGDAIDLEKIRGVMGQLPDKQRQAFEAVVTGGKSVTEAAEEMGISKQAVSAYINYAKVKIKAAVGVEDERPAQAPPEPQKPAQTLAEKVAAQRASGKKAAPPKAKPKPKTMVSMSGGNYELVKQNDDGTVTVKNDQGDEFTSEPGEDFTVAGPEPRKSAWKKNEDGTYTAPNGVVWKKAAEGGEVSPITGEPFKGGRLMPIHGLHQKQPDKPKPQAGGDASAIKPNENAKQAKPAEPRAPMSPEMIEAERERRERESQWQAVKSGPLGDALSLGDRPHNIKHGHGIAKKWMEQAEAMGPESVKRAGEFAKQRAIENKRQEFAKYAESLGGAGNTMIDPKWSGNAGEPYSVDQAAKEYAEDAESLIAENNPQQWGITKKHLADNPHTHSARLWVSNMLEGKNQLKDLHDLHQHIADIGKQPEAAAPPPTPEPPAKSGPPGVSESDIPFQAAYNAHAGMSHVPEKRAKQRQAEYVAQMTADWDHLSKLAKTPEQKEALAAEFERYRTGFRDKTLAVLHAGSRVMSPMITGPARFPTASNRKRGDTYDKRIGELLDFRKRAMSAITKKLSPESGPVKSSDSNAVETLQKQLDAAQKYQEAAKEVNKIVRSHVASAERDGGPVTFKPGKTRESAIEAIKALGLSEKTASEALKGDYMGRVGIPDYSLKNNNANMRRIKQRIEELSKMKATPAKSEEYSGGVEVHEDPEAARIRIKFPGKPERDAIDKLKRAGFRWSPTEGAWQRHLNSAGRYAVNDVLKSLGHTKQEAAAPQSPPVSDDVPEMLPMSDDDAPESPRQEFDPANHIKIAADDIASLRRQDVYRVLNAAPEGRLNSLVAWINKNRPDLSGEVHDAVIDIGESQSSVAATEQSPGSSLTGWHKDEFTGLHDAMKRQLTGEGPRRQESLARSLMESSPPAVQKELFRALKSIAPEAHAAIAAKPGIHLHKETFQ